MSRLPLASIIINNFNYGRFLREAIDSALSQTYSRTEVIVVDDGSTDNSRDIIASYGKRIAPILKENAGQASAFNAGLTMSRGDLVCFLDSDDVLLPTAMEKAADLLCTREPAKVHWPLWIIDEYGKRTGTVTPRQPLPEGDLRERVLYEGPSSTASPPTTGNAWSRRFLERVFPVPEAEYRLCADDYLYALAPAFGPIRRISEPQGAYRLHGQNRYQGMSFEQKLDVGFSVQDDQCRVLSKFFGDMGIEVDLNTWKSNLWFHRLHLAIHEITALVPPGDTFILVDRNRWGTDDFVAGRRRLPFLEREGQYGGAPPDDGTALREFERLRESGATFIVFGWPAFWWLNDYLGLHHRLRSQFHCILENERLIVFDLRT
jgi:glycosyltransferase involved in cell wall biosynthesis